MCYICEVRGRVGKRYKETQHEIARAWRVWAASRREPLSSLLDGYKPGPTCDGGWLVNSYANLRKRVRDALVCKPWPVACGCHGKHGLPLQGYR